MKDPKMMSCHDVIAQLWEYIDDELTPERMQRIRDHLDVCSRCFPQYDFQRAFVTMLKRREWQPVPPDLRRRVFERILAESAEEE